MAKFFTELNEHLREFIARQRIFFHASVPNKGRINLSPKGLDTFGFSATNAWATST